MKYLRPLVTAILLTAIVVCAWRSPIDAKATVQLDAALEKALWTFATVRGLSGVVSVLQATQIDAQPAGVGATFSPGQILAPLNEVLRQFADFMLVACAVLAVEKLLVSIGGWPALAAAVTVVSALWFALSFRRSGVPAHVSKLLILVLMFRFAVPLCSVGTTYLYEQFLSKPYQTSQQALSISRGQAEASSSTPAANDPTPNIWGRMKNWMQDKVSPLLHLGEMKAAAENASRHIVNLIAVFMLQTLIVPLGLLACLYAGMRTLLAERRTGPTRSVRGE